MHPMLSTQGVSAGPCGSAAIAQAWCQTEALRSSKDIAECVNLTATAAIAGRYAFLLRLRRTVKWLNEHRWEDGLALRTNAEEQATGVQELLGTMAK